MRVLHVISSGGMYGAEAVILNLARCMNESGHTSLLAVFHNSAQPNLQLYEAAVKNGLETHRISCKGQLDLSVPKQIAKIAAQVKADVVHLHGYKADLYGFFGLRGKSTPLVSTCHTWYDNDLIVRVYGVLDRLVLRRFARIVAVSDEVRERLLLAGVRSERIRLIRNGIDLRPFEAATLVRDTAAVDSTLTVGLVGRLAPEKGVDIFLQAAAIVLGQYTGNVRFVIVGDGPEQARLLEQVSNLAIEKHMTLAGHRDGMPAFYASLDVLVSASRQEGLPMTLLEGMASRLPVVATSVGAVSTVVQDGKTGLLVEPEDAVALAKAMMLLLEDNALRTKLSEAGHNMVQKEFSASRMMEDYLEVYREALGTRQ